MGNLMRILYVDDEILNLEVMNILFMGEFEVITSLSVTESLEIIKNRPVDIVISDMKMPIMNGLEFVAKAKELNNNVHNFILSGFDMNVDIHKALNSGLINGFFQKPMNKAEISKVLLSTVS